MEIKEVERQIVQQVEDINGFLVQLHSRAVFDEDKYQTLITSLKTYDKLLGDEEVVNRYLANCLLQLEAGLSDAYATLEDLGHLNTRTRVGDAAAELWELLVQLLTPPRLRNK